MSQEQANKSLQRILVTGGAGFIGSHTVDLLLAQDKEVLVLDDLSSGKLANLNLQHPNLEFIEGNVLEYFFLEELIAQVDAVLHLAAIVSVPKSLENPILSFQVNTQGILHVLQAVYKTGRQIPIVQASSAAVYGGESPCHDDMPLSRHPLSPYALQKIHAEDYGNLYNKLYGIKSTALRYFNVYGPRQEAASPYSGVISRFIEAYKNNGPLIIYGDGRQTRDFIHVKDVAKANWLALQHHEEGEFNIAAGSPHSLLQVIEYIKNAGKHDPVIQFKPQRPGDIQHSCAVTQKAEKVLGFNYSISVQDGMQQMMNV
jgi:UDP-glucose 4-epimerase